MARVPPPPRSRWNQKNEWKLAELSYTGAIPQRVSLPILNQVWRATGLRGKTPPVYSEQIAKAYGALGMQPIYSRRLTLDPSVVRGLRSFAFPQGRNLDALKTLIHEYAHTAQPRALRREIAEGGAEAWAGEHLPRIARLLGAGRPGFSDLPPGIAYEPWTRRINWATGERRQFGR